MKMKRCRVVTVSSVCRLELTSPSSLRAAITTKEEEIEGVRQGGREGGREEERTLFSLTASVAAKTATRRAREKEAEEPPLPPSFARIAPRKESFLLAFGGADDADDHDDDMMAYFLCLADTE